MHGRILEKGMGRGKWEERRLVLELCLGEGGQGGVQTRDREVEALKGAGVVAVAVVAAKAVLKVCVVHLWN
jgi:hypothetical protein